jgi:hypothetical protein
MHTTHSRRAAHAHTCGCSAAQQHTATHSSACAHHLSQPQFLHAPPAGPIKEACLAKRPSNHSAGAAWGWGGGMYTSSTALLVKAMRRRFRQVLTTEAIRGCPRVLVQGIRAWLCAYKAFGQRSAGDFTKYW